MRKKTTASAAKADHFKQTEIQNQTEEALQPQPQPQQVICFVFSPVETDTIFNALGELPAKISEGLRAKLKAQAEQQPTLLKGLYAEPSVQAILAS